MERSSVPYSHLTNQSRFSLIGWHWCSFVLASFVDVFLMGRPSEPYTHVDVDDCESQVGVMGRPSEPFKTPILPKCDHPSSQPPDLLEGKVAEPYSHVDVDYWESQDGIMGRPSEPFKTPILPKCDHSSSQPPVIFLKGRSSEPYSHVDVELKETARTGAPVRETRLYDPGIAKVEPPRGTPPVDGVACGIPPARRWAGP